MRREEKMTPREYLDILHTAERLKDTMRHSATSGGRVESVGEHNREAKQSGGIIIACGMSRFDKDNAVAPVFERADHAMYENKISLKS